jgi:hypothetical protein
LRRLLAVCSWQRLAAKYGDASAARVVGALRHAGERMEGEGVNVSLAILDPPGTPPADTSASAVRAALGPALAADRPDGILLVGGDDIEPFFRLSNPVRDRSVDPDLFVLSDAPYGMADGMEIPVGRIPDGGPEEIESLLTALAGLGTRPSWGRHGLLAVANGEWLDSAQAVVEGQGATVHTAPGWNATRSEWKTERPRCTYFNVHGFPDRPAWRAMDENTGIWQDVLTPADVTFESGRGAFVFSEACYGAAVLGKSAQSSIALAFVRTQCNGFVGATGLAFGSYAVSLRPELADAVARRLLDAVLSGEEFGPALVSARATARAASGTSTFLQKTAEQFVLYGNPLASL